MSHDASTGESPEDVRRAFGADHHRLEELFGRLLEAFESDARPDVERLWGDLDARLRAHLDLEERRMLPRLAAVDPGEVAALRDEHERLRRLLLSLGVGVDLHATRAESARSFVELLRAHARREDALLYRWADRELGTVERAAVVGDLGRGGEAGRRAASPGEGTKTLEGARNMSGTTTNDGIRPDLRAALDELEALRDTVRLRIHLAGMDLKREWDDVDRRFLAARDAVRKARDGARGEAQAVTHEALAEITRGIRQVRDALERPAR